MSGVWKRLIVPVAAVFIVTASWQVSPAVAAAGQAGMAVKAPKAGAAARARVNVKATSTEVANEVVRLFTERGYRLAKQKGNRLVFQQPANVTLVQLAQGSGLGGAAVARGSARAVACHRRDDPARGIDAANPMVLRIGDEQVASGIDGDTDGEVERSCGRWSSISGEAKGPIARHRGDDP